MAEIRELPVGKYNAVRTLRHLLQQAERGDFDDVVVVCYRREPEPGKNDTLWACWSDMRADHVWFIVGWLFAFVQRRYFSGSGLNDG